jgi:DNA-binding transcriptional ArsR family regulator
MSVDRSTVGRPATRLEVARLLGEGLSRTAISARLGVSKATVSYHAKRLGLPGSPACGRRYDWAQVQAYYDAGHSIADCQRHFGFARRAWALAAKRGDVVGRPQATPLAVLLRSGTPRGRWNLKRRLLAEGLKRDACEECGIADWRGRPLSLALHHVNGDRNDNRLENLALLCPNCHSQTANFGILNRRPPSEVRGDVAAA